MGIRLEEGEWNMKLTSEQKEQALKELYAIGLSPVEVKAPSSIVVHKIEVAGNLLILTGAFNGFGKSRNITQVFRRVR